MRLWQTTQIISETELGYRAWIESPASRKFSGASANGSISRKLLTGARKSGFVTPNEDDRSSAYQKLQHDLLAGDFEENGRSRVLYLHPATTKARMTRAWMQDATDYNYDNHQGRSAYLEHCWLPRNLFQRWLASIICRTYHHALHLPSD